MGSPNRLAPREELAVTSLCPLFGGSGLRPHPATFANSPVVAILLTPFAFANFSPGLALGLTLGQKFQLLATLKALPTPSALMRCDLLYPGLFQPWLKLVNAFGVKYRRWALKPDHDYFDEGFDFDFVGWDFVE